MRIAAVVVALFSIAIGVVGIVWPDRLTAARENLIETPGILYVTGPVRVAMGIVLLVFAPKSRMPRMLRVVGVIVVAQGIIPQLIGQERARAILAQETAMGAGALRVGAMVALATGVLIAYAAMPTTERPSGSA